jgi:hypothetical protein
MLWILPFIFISCTRTSFVSLVCNTAVENNTLMAKGESPAGSSQYVRVLNIFPNSIQYEHALF